MTRVTLAGLTKALGRIRTLAAQQRVRFTMKALRELAVVGLDWLDACEALEGLRSEDFIERLASERTGEWMYVFKPQIGAITFYVKVVLRSECLVISFHEDEDDEDGEENGR